MRTRIVFCRTQVPLVFGIPHSYSLTSFALDLYPSEQFNSEQTVLEYRSFLDCKL